MSTPKMSITPKSAQNNTILDPGTRNEADEMADIEPMLAQKEAPQNVMSDTRISDALANMGSENEKATFGERLADNVKALNDVLTGKNRLQPAYAGAGMEYSSMLKNNDITENMRSDMTIRPGAAPDGGDLVVPDYPVSRDLPQNEAAKEARQNLKRIQGKTIKMGQSDIEATFNKRNRGELMRRNDKMSGNQYGAKVDLAGNADELFSTARDVDMEPNKKVKQKPSVARYAKGVSYGQDGSGKVYSMNVKSEVNKNGAISPHSITSINEVPGGIIRKSGDQLRNAQAPRSNMIISQNDKNVQISPETVNPTQSRFAQNTATNRNFSDETRKALKTSNPQPYML